MGLSPTDKPELVILLVLYNPTGEGGHQGGAVASPTAGKILSEVLPYMEVKKQEEAKEEKIFAAKQQKEIFLRRCSAPPFSKKA